MSSLTTDELNDSLIALDTFLRQQHSLIIAFSGGADSAFLLAAASRALGTDRVVAATAVSPSLPTTELEAAAEFAQSLGVRHLTPATHEMRRPGYTANGPDRCFHCKAELLDVLTELRQEVGASAVATGTNADDLVAGFRPGIRAAALRGALTPLADVGLTKPQIREASRQWGLPTHDKPAAACLSSRIAYGIDITPARLRRVERAEHTLRLALHDAEIPVRDLRVRDVGGRARIEIDRDRVGTLSRRHDILNLVGDGFVGVDVDPRGFRSGSMNESLTVRSAER